MYYNDHKYYCNAKLHEYAIIKSFYLFKILKITLYRLLFMILLIIFHNEVKNQLEKSNNISLSSY